MKKPKYTRQTKYQLPRIADQYTVRELEESVRRNTAKRQRIILELKGAKQLSALPELVAVPYSDLLDALRKFSIATVGISAEIANGAFNNEFAARVVVINLLRAKKGINQNLNATKRILKSIFRKNLIKPPGALQRYHPSTPVEVIDIVRNSPIVVEYLEKLFIDIDNGPFKGIFRWVAGINSGRSFWDGKQRLWITLRAFDNGYKFYNRKAAFRTEYQRVCRYNFKVFNSWSLKTL